MSGFIFTEGSHEDFDACIDITLQSFHTFKLWAQLWKGVSMEEQRKWWRSGLAKRYELGDTSMYLMKEEATGKVVGWSSLQWPWDLKPVPEDMKEVATKIDLARDCPPPPPGFNEIAGMAIVFMIDGCLEYGYNPQTDFHRRGSFILPSYHKLKLAEKFTTHANSIADHAGRKTYVSARPETMPGFMSLNYKVLGPPEAKVVAAGGIPKNPLMFWFGVRHPVRVTSKL